MLRFLKQYFMPIYISELDQFLSHFDATHPLSAVQQKEREKYRRLYQLRDQAD
ncbi:MAG TPA: CBU_0585 family protein [Gammaproteobacteria bacterium]|nr:CBU_0585 family protein [Gammaproteobacteria bacterium]